MKNTNAPQPNEPADVRAFYLSHTRTRELQTEIITKREKLRDRARFLVGQMMLDDPELWAMVRPRLEAKIKALGTSATVIEDYEKNIEEIRRIRDAF